MTRALVAMGRHFASAALLSLLVVGCFEPAEKTKGLPCTEDASCGGLSCSYGFCGGPPRCASGAGVGDYCFEVAGAPMEIGAPVTALAVAAIDIDPWPDLVVASGDDGRIVVLGNDGAGGVMTTVATTTVGAPVTDVGIGEVDDAGLADVVATTASAVTFHPLVAAGGGASFSGAITVGSGLAGPRKPQIGSFVDDAERRADVAILLDNGFDVLPQTGASSFGAAIHTSVSAPTDLRSLGMAMERVYVAASKTNSVIGHDRKVDGSFTAKIEIDVGTAPERFAIADVDRDGFSDLVVVGSDGGVWLTTGKNAAQDDWSLPQKVYALGWRPSSITTVNLDDDVEPEYVIAGVAQSGRGDVYLFDNDGDGKPLYGGSLGVDGAVVAVADLDRDGVAELVAGSGDARVVVARRTVAPPPVGGEESGSTTTGDDPTQPTGPGMTVDPSDSNPSVPGTMTDPTDSATDPMDGSESGLLPCGDGLGIFIDITCYELEPVMPLAADGHDLAIGDFSGDFVNDVVVAADDGTVTGYNAVGVTNDLAFLSISEGAAEVAIATFLDIEGIAESRVVFTDGNGLHVVTAGDPSGSTFDVPLVGAHSPGVVTIADEMFSQPGLALAAADGVFVARAPDDAPGVGLPLPGIVDIATWAFGASEVLVADGVDVRLYAVASAGLTELFVLDALGAATAVGDMSVGYAGSDGDTLAFVGFDQNVKEIATSSMDGFGTVIGGFEGGDITGDGVEDLVVVRGVDFGGGVVTRLLTVVPIGYDGIMQPPIDLTSGVGAVALDISVYPPAIYFTTLAEEWGVSSVQRFRGGL